MAYSLDINCFAKCTNSFIASKAKCLLFDILLKINQSFWPETFSGTIYLLNRFFLSFFKYDYLLVVWLRIYNISNLSCIPDFGHHGTLVTEFIDKKQVKSQNTTSISGREKYSKINFCKNVNKLLNGDFLCLYQSHINTQIWAYIYTCPKFDNVISTHSTTLSISTSYKRSEDCIPWRSYSTPLPGSLHGCRPGRW